VSRAPRNQPGLVRNRDGYWAIRWGRKLHREMALPERESTQSQDHEVATRVFRTRYAQVLRSMGEPDGARLALGASHPVALDVAITDFLVAYRRGDISGRVPTDSTVELVATHLLGKRGGLMAFALASGSKTTADLTPVFVTRWLESLKRRLASDTLRLKLCAARQLSAFLAERGVLADDSAAAIARLKRPPSARGRARVEGTPSLLEIQRLLSAMSPTYWGQVAELQFRLGLRRSEVMALEADWIEADRNCVRVVADERFDTKSHESRDVDGADPRTIGLAFEVVELKRRHRLTVRGYEQAWKRACAKLVRQGTPWNYKSKSHALRAAYATQSRLAGISLPDVRDRLGHQSEKTTERAYIGSQSQVAPAPFADRPLMSQRPDLRLVKTG
jgi:integrase